MSPNLITIDLAPLAGKRIKITVESDATILRVKQLFFEKEGIPPECVKLNFQNRKVEDSEQLDVLEIVDNSTLFLRIFLYQMHIIPQQ